MADGTPNPPAARPSAHAPRRFIVLAFTSTRESLAAEAALLDSGVTVKAVPLPRHRGPLCGIALRIPPEEAARAEAALSDHGIRIAARDVIDDV